MAARNQAVMVFQWRHTMGSARRTQSQKRRRARKWVVGWVIIGYAALPSAHWPGGASGGAGARELELARCVHVIRTIVSGGQAGRQDMHCIR